MRTSFRFALATLAVSLVALTAACASPEDEDVGEDGASALTGTIEQAQACAIRNAYKAASLSDFHAVYMDAGSVASHASQFYVPTVGQVVVVEQTASGGATSSSFSYNGAVKAKAVTQGSVMSWKLPAGTALTCPSSASSSYRDAGGAG